MGGSGAKRQAAQAEADANREKAQLQANIDAEALRKKMHMEGRARSSTGGRVSRYAGSSNAAGTILAPMGDTTSFFG